MDFENLFSKPPNPALGKRPASNADKRFDDEVDDTEVEEAQEEKIKWEVKLEYEQIPKKSPNEYSPHPPYSPDLALVQFLALPKSPYDYKRHFGNSTTTPKSLPYRKSRSKDYESYSDNDTCSQEPENNFEKELQKYIRAKEMANAAQPLPSSKESVTKEGVKDTKLSAKPKNKNLKPGHKNGKQKKMKQKRPGTGNEGPDALLQKSSRQEEGQAVNVTDGERVGSIWEKCFKDRDT